MILGIEASMTLTATGTTPGTPSQRGMLDFVNDSYVFDGNTLTLAAVVNTPSRRSASGLEIIGGSPVQLLGVPLTFVLAANWTTVIDFHINGAIGFPGREIDLMSMYDAGFNNSLVMSTIGDGFISSDIFEDNGAGDTRDAFGDNSFPSNTNYKFAATRNTAHVALSLAGEAMVTDAVNNTAINISSWAFAPTKVPLADGSSPTHHGFIRSISFYDPLVDSLLPGLSA